MCRSFFFSVGAVPSKSHVTVGIGLPVMVAGILTVAPARQRRRSLAETPSVITGSSVKLEQRHLLVDNEKPTQG